MCGKRVEYVRVGSANKNNKRIWKFGPKFFVVYSLYKKSKMCCKGEKRWSTIRYSVGMSTKNSILPHLTKRKG